MKIPADVITNFARGKTDSQQLCPSYTTLYEDLVQPELLSVAGLTGAAGSKAEKYSFFDFATEATTFRRKNPLTYAPKRKLKHEQRHT